jgi:DNA repair exonuclease SbcCD ATPase subunit
LKEEKDHFEKVCAEIKEVSDKENNRIKERDAHDKLGQEISLRQRGFNDLQSTLIRLSSELSHLERKAEEEKTIHSAIDTLTKEIQGIEKKLEEANKQLGVTKFWVSGFKELATLRLTGYVEGINAKMQELLEDFGMNCWIDVLEAKKSAKDMFSLESYKRKANLFVSGNGKSNVSIEGYSGGERQLLCLAMVLSLGSVIGNINYLALDETFGSLDTTNRAKVLELLNREKKNGLLSGACVLIISHDDEIKNGAEFDSIIQIKKDDEGSILNVEED